MQTFFGMRPSRGTKTGRVWEIADELSKSCAGTELRQSVIKAFHAEGGNPNTAATQFSAWNKVRKDQFRKPKAAFEQNSSIFQLSIGKDGRVLIPVELRARMDLDNATTLNATLIGGELILTTPKSALEKLRNMVKKMDNSNVSVVDELLLERRDEANQ